MKKKRYDDWPTTPMERNPLPAKPASAKTIFTRFAQRSYAIAPDTLELFWNQPWPHVCWNAPLHSFIQDGVGEVKKSAREAIINLPFDDRNSVMEAFNEFMATEFPHSGFTAITWDKVHSSDEIKIELLKLTQTGNPEGNHQSRDELAAALFMSPEALKPHLKKLQQGMNLLGSHVKIELAHSDNVYDSTIHPIFLALNLTEVNFLVNCLRLQFRGSEFEKIADDIAADVYRQLSDYGKRVTDRVAGQNAIEAMGDRPKRELRPGYRKEIDTQDIPYLFKSRQCVMEDISNSGEKIYGKIRAENGEYVFEAVDGEKYELTESFLSSHSLRPI